MKIEKQSYKLIWTPEGRCIATVEALNPSKAIRMAPKPYRKYLGEICAELIGADGKTDFERSLEKD